MVHGEWVHVRNSNNTRHTNTRFVWLALAVTPAWGRLQKAQTKHYHQAHSLSHCHFQSDELRHRHQEKSQITGHFDPKIRVVKGCHIHAVALHKAGGIPCFVDRPALEYHHQNFRNRFGDDNSQHTPTADPKFPSGKNTRYSTQKEVLMAPRAMT